MTSSRHSELEADSAFGFFDRSLDAPGLFQPRLISNDDDNTMLRAIRHELKRASSFTFSVAFITTAALAMLKQPLLDSGIRGTIITSTYLGFNSPDMFRELMTLPNVDVYVHDDSKGGFHPKGYIFHGEATVTAIVGSSNLTDKALVSNREWNLRFSALPNGDLTQQLEIAVEAQLKRSQQLSTSWIDDYAASYVAPREALPGTSTDEPLRPLADMGRIVPNAMQDEALESIESVRQTGETRALVISATGTGKTVLAALDVRSFNPHRMLFIVHREQIIDRAIEEFRAVLAGTAREDEFGKFVGGRRELDKRYVFATIQSLAQTGVLESIDPSMFDYILIDEVHRAGAASYLRVINHFTPAFLLGMTATPERTDGANIFEYFDHNVAYEIRLRAALDAGMLAPFHYFGVTDYVNDHGDLIDETSDLRHLTGAGRLKHLVKALETYGHSGNVSGLIFCSRNDEAAELSRLLNETVVIGRRMRTVALSGSQDQKTRTDAVRLLESGELDYILTVDIFNEGIDIPSINQVVMLRQTQSAIVFTQQLGRGLRKAEGKDHLRVIDFIGNYANNFLIPLALLGDRSHSKDVVRQKMIAVEEAGTLSGVSTVNFDQISRERVLGSLASTNLDSLPKLKAAYSELEYRLGRTPALLDFARFDSVDPVTVASKYGNYWRFLEKIKRVDDAPESRESALLTFISAELLNGKRPHELIVLRELIEKNSLSRGEVGELLVREGCSRDAATIDSVLRVLSLEFFTKAARAKYGDELLSVKSDSSIALSPAITRNLSASGQFREFLSDSIDTGLFLARHRYNWSGSFIEGQLYSRKDACRILNWKKNEEGTINGYKVDAFTQTCPIFVNYHKNDEISAGTRYKDALLDPSTMRWFTRNPKRIESAEVKSIVSGDFPLHMFVKRDDAEGKSYFYLGEASARDAVQTKMIGNNGSEVAVVAMNLDLVTPIEESLFDYLVTKSVQTGQ